MLKAFLPLILFCAAFAQIAQADIEYGSTSELGGVQKIFVATGPDIKLRDSIVKEISKKLPSLVFCDSVDDAEVVLQFGSSAETVLTGVTHTTIPGTDVRSSRPQYSQLEIATGYVAKFTSARRLRILMSFKDTRSTAFERKTSTNFARAFVAAYLKAQKEREELEKNPYYRMLTGKDKKPS